MLDRGARPGREHFAWYLPCSVKRSLIFVQLGHRLLFWKWPSKLVVVTIEQFSEKRTLFVKTVRFLPVERFRG